MKRLQRNIGMALLLVLTLSLYLFLLYALWNYDIKPFFSLKRWHFIVSGEFLKGCFDIRQAGTCFDQPTIGRYLYGFSMISFLSSASLVMLRFRLSSASLWQQGLLILFAAISTFFAFLLLLTPTCLLLHYVTSMGMTTNRLLGLLLCAGAWIVLPCFAFAACRKQWERSWLYVVNAWGALIIPLLFPSYPMLRANYYYIRHAQFSVYLDVLALIIFGVWISVCILAVYLCRLVWITKSRVERI